MFSKTVLFDVRKKELFEIGLLKVAAEFESVLVFNLCKFAVISVDYGTIYFWCLNTTVSLTLKNPIVQSHFIEM